MWWEPIVHLHPPGRKRWNGGGHHGNYFDDTDRETPHPTSKPLSMIRSMDERFSDPDELVVDPFMGSGSTAVACRIEGHDFIGCDIDPGAVDIARARTAFWTPERHRLELVNAAALRAEEKRQEEATARGQLDWTRGL